MKPLEYSTEAIAKISLIGLQHEAIGTVNRTKGYSTKKRLEGNYG